MQRDPNVESAAFILWGHDVEMGKALDPAKLFSQSEAGWTPWVSEVSEPFTAHFRGPKPLAVWLFWSDREAPTAKRE